MGRPASRWPLHVWMNGLHVGTWHAHPGRADELAYDPNWMRHPQGRPLSLSLPFPVAGQALRGERVANWFDNLLPDSLPIRRRIAAQFRLSSAAPTFELLSAIGRDCVGAVQLLPPGVAGTPAHVPQGRVISSRGIQRLLDDTVADPGSVALPAGLEDAAEDDDARPDRQPIRISLAGAQEKTALVRAGGRWLIPDGTTPTTHILKLPLGIVGGGLDLTHSVTNEWACLALLRALGLSACRAEVARFGTRQVLVVERFDRRTAADGSLLRLPQEDLLQALAHPGENKYEKHGGPGMLQAVRLLQQSTRADADVRQFMALQILFWLLRAPDGHAKNFSLQHLPQGAFRLAPAYDVLSAWPHLQASVLHTRLQIQAQRRRFELAMAWRSKNAHYRFEAVHRWHMVAAGERLQLGIDMPGLLDELLAGLPRACARVLALARSRQRLAAGLYLPTVERIIHGATLAAQSLERQGNHPPTSGHSR